MYTASNVDKLNIAARYLDRETRAQKDVLAPNQEANRVLKNRKERKASLPTTKAVRLSRFNVQSESRCKARADSELIRLLIIQQNEDSQTIAGDEDIPDLNQDNKEPQVVNPPRKKRVLATLLCDKALKQDINVAKVFETRVIESTIQMPLQELIAVAPPIATQFYARQRNTNASSIEVRSTHIVYSEAASMSFLESLEVRVVQFQNPY